MHTYTKHNHLVSLFRRLFDSQNIEKIFMLERKSYPKRRKRFKKRKINVQRHFIDKNR